MRTADPVLSPRTLNRTLLERQLLVNRDSRTALEAVAHLVAMQSQEPNWPYVGLWTRLVDFRHDDLTSLLTDRRVVRSTVLRGTQHLVASEDYPWLRPSVQPALDRWQRMGYFTRETDGIEPAELASAGRELLADQPLTRREFSRLLAERYPGRAARVIAGAAELTTPMVHPPPGGAWGKWGNRAGLSVALADVWLGREMAAPRLDAMIHRYLAAFGPASVMDIQAWSGLTRLKDVVDPLRPGLRTFRDEQGRELFDLPDAPLADAAGAVPVRFLPAYDNLLLGHADRTRVISDEDRKQVISGSEVRPTFLVDGFVHGTWSLTDGTLLLRSFRPLSTADTAAVLAEAERLLAFVVEDPTAYDIAFA